MFVDFVEVFTLLKDLLNAALEKGHLLGREREIEREWGLDWFELVIVGAQEEGVGQGMDVEPLLLTLRRIGA